MHAFTRTHSHAYAYAYAHTHTHAYSHTLTHVRMLMDTQTFTHTYAHTHLCSCMRTHTHARLFTCTHRYAHTRAYLHSHIHTQTCTHTPAHILTHTHTHTYVPTHSLTYAHAHTRRLTGTRQHASARLPKPLHVRTPKSNPSSVFIYIYFFAFFKAEQWRVGFGLRFGAVTPPTPSPSSSLSAGRPASRRGPRVSAQFAPRCSGPGPRRCRLLCGWERLRLMYFLSRGQVRPLADWTVLGDADGRQAPGPCGACCLDGVVLKWCEMGLFFPLFFGRGRGRHQGGVGWGGGGSGGGRG